MANLSTSFPLLLDAVGFGISATLADVDACRFLDILAPWARRPEALSDQAFGDGLALALKIPTGGGATVATDLRLHLASFDGGFRITARSGIRLNPMRALAAELGGVETLDPRGNAIGPHPGESQALLERQVDWIARAVDTAVDLLRHAAEGAAGADGPVVLDEALWPRSAEACRDRRINDAGSAMLRLRAAVLEGAVAVDEDLYRLSAGRARGAPTVRWWRTRVGPVVKAYAKATHLLRVEVAAPDREAVLPGAGSGAIEGAVAAGQIAAFARAAAPLLAEAVDHVDAALARRPSPADLVVDLLPLVDLAAGRHSPGRGMKPTAQARFDARRMLDALIETGEAWATGMDGHGSVRRTLDALAAPGGPLRRDGRRAHFVVSRPAPPRAETIR